jgi:hypothetical protein
MKKLTIFLSFLFAITTISKAQESLSVPNVRSITKPEQISKPATKFQRASNNIIFLDFEGLSNNDPINDFYNGGLSGKGNTGSDYGVQFSLALGKIDADAPGGNGNFANEPSPSTIMFFLDSGNEASVNIPAGFSNAFSCYYAAGYDGSINIYDGLDGTGNLLATLPLPINNDDYNTCTGDPNGWYCNWDEVSVSFNGIAKSIVFIGPSDYVGFDDMTFGSDSPGPTAVPVSNWALYLAVVLIGLFVLYKYKIRIAL